MSSQSLRSVLVIGGCGFLGYEIVRLLAKESGCSIAVTSRNPQEPRVDGITYHACDITDVDSLQTLLANVQPQVIIHSASPLFFLDKVDKSALHQTNILGTQNLLKAAISTKSVRALIYTSSSSIHIRSSKSLITEDAPLVDRSTSTDEYAITKAIADTTVLEANSSELRTICLRLPAIYGERDTQLIPGSLAVLRDGNTHMQLGNNKNLYDAVYVGNAAYAHVLAAKALLKDEPLAGVAGEAFFITDDAPIPFWDFQRELYAAAGSPTDLTQVRVIPAWVGMGMAALVEYVYWIFTFGKKLPPKGFRRDVLRYAVEDKSHCIDKAKARLGYRPLVDKDEGIRRGVAWTLQQQATVSKPDA
ncbi:MAG: hypothetical protein LQ337_003559 [Flavoplaca oasis]|nr:MAG: hypothetical protein LQ337_003559 [Flavoplaca oasis]